MIENIYFNCSNKIKINQKLQLDLSKSHTTTKKGSQEKKYKENKLNKSIVITLSALELSSYTYTSIYIYFYNMLLLKLCIWYVQTNSIHVH